MTHHSVLPLELHVEISASASMCLAAWGIMSCLRVCLHGQAYLPSAARVRAPSQQDLPNSHVFIPMLQLAVLARRVLVTHLVSKLTSITISTDYGSNLIAVKQCTAFFWEVGVPYWAPVYTALPGLAKACPAIYMWYVYAGPSSSCWRIPSYY
jgi:hypothetical protein